MLTTTRDTSATHANEPCCVMVSGSSADDNLLRRVRSEFSEMPGMRLTLEQASRLWTLDRDACARVLGSLVATKFLECDGTGRYRKTHCGY
jgi:hypothetical protein